MSKRTEMIDEANDLGIEFKGNVSNVNLAALIAVAKGEGVGRARFEVKLLGYQKTVPANLSDVTEIASTAATYSSAVNQVSVLPSGSRFTALTGTPCTNTSNVASRNAVSAMASAIQFSE